MLVGFLTALSAALPAVALQPEMGMAMVMAFLGLVVAGFTPSLAIPLLRRANIVDEPNHRSLHLVPAVRGGGVATLAGVLVAGGVALGTFPADSRPLLVVLMLTVSAGILGLAEDLVGLSVHMRLAGQLIIGTLAGVVAGDLAGLPGWWAVPLGVMLAGYMNAANFMDGVNGISALHGIVCGGYFLVVGLVIDQTWLMLVSALLGAVHLGFLPWNIRGRLFLGDVGSYLLGAMVAACSLGAMLAGAGLMLAIGPTLPYLADTASTMMRRALRREPLLQAHRTHAYQRLVGAGCTHLQGAAIVAVASVMCGVVAYGVHWGPVPYGLGWLLILTVLGGYLYLPFLLEARGRVALP